PTSTVRSSLALHDALPTSDEQHPLPRVLDPLDVVRDGLRVRAELLPEPDRDGILEVGAARLHDPVELVGLLPQGLHKVLERGQQDRKSTRLNSSHQITSYA